MLKESIEKLHSDKVEEALRDFLYLYEVNKDNYELLFYICCALMRLGFNKVAEILLIECRKNDPGNLGSTNNLGFIYKKQAREEEAIQMFSEAMQGKPDDVDIVNNLASMHVGYGNAEKALYYVNKALELSPDHASAQWNKSLTLLEMGDYEGGWNLYDSGYRSEELGEAKRKNKQYYKDFPFWDGTPGKTVVVYGEQGIGDEIMFASMLPDLIKDCNVIYDAHPRLCDLMRNSFEIPIYGTRKDNDIHWPETFPIDAKIALGSLGKFYRKKKEDFPKKPYLKAEQKYIDKWKNKLVGDKPKIGISWRGGTPKTAMHRRSIPLEIIKNLLIPEVEWYSLQYNEDAHEDANFLGVNHDSEMLADYDETAGFIHALDLVITVPQSIMHLCGALDVDCWMMAPYKHTWQMGVFGEDLPWYGSLKTYWQLNDENWEPVINRVKEDLKCYIAKNIAA